MGATYFCACTLCRAYHVLYFGSYYNAGRRSKAVFRGFFFPAWYFCPYTEQAMAHYYWEDHFLGTRGSFEAGILFCFHTPAHQHLSWWATSVKERRNSEKDGGKRGKGKKRQRQSSSDEASASDTETHQPSSSRTRSVRPPSRYCDEETADSDESDTVCIICGCREPPVKDSIVFWVDCDSCGEWAHTHCALGCNSATRNCVCLSCTQK